MINQLLPLAFRHLHDGFHSFAALAGFGFTGSKCDLAGTFLVGLPVGNGARVSHQKTELLLKPGANFLFPCGPFFVKRRSTASMSAPRFEDHIHVAGAGEASGVVVGFQRIQPGLSGFADLAIGNKFAIPIEVLVIRFVKLGEELVRCIKLLPNMLGVRGIKKPLRAELFGPALTLTASRKYATRNLVDFTVRGFHAYRSAVLFGFGCDISGDQTHGK